MSRQSPHCCTLEEYFALELQSDAKYEYRDGEVYEVSGVSPEHALIEGNLHCHFKNQLRGRACRLFSSRLRVKVPAAPPYRYPDLTALCGQPEYEVIWGVQALINPALIVEILSPSTEAYDRGDKFSDYKSIPSFGEYLLIAQHRPHVTHYVRQPNGSWSYEDANELSATLMLPTIDCVLPLNEVYQDVEFTSPESRLPPHLQVET